MKKENNIMETCSDQTKKNREAIKKSSRKIILTLKVCCGFIPLATCLIWLFINKLPGPIQQQILPDFVQLPLPLPTRLAGFAITLIPSGIMIFGIIILMRLFQLYQDGRIFHSENVTYLQTLSRTLIIFCIAGIITDALLSVVLTLHHPQGQRMISLGLEGQDFTLLIVGYIMATIARVMQEGCRLQEEHSLTV